MRASLKALQLQHNLTNKEMAKIGGVDSVTLWRIYKNELDGSFTFWANIKDHFNLTWANLKAY